MNKMKNNQLNLNTLNYLNEINACNNRSSQNMSQNKFSNMRRSSLGNMNSYDENAFIRLNFNNLNLNQLRPQGPLSPIFPGLNNNLLNDETLFKENENKINNFNFQTELSSNQAQQSLSSSYLLNEANQRENSYLNFSKSPSYQLTSSPLSNIQNETNFLYPPASSLALESPNCIQTSSNSNKANLRRRSYHFGQINSLLQPVHESRPISPINSHQIKIQQQRELETKLNMLICANSMLNNQTKSNLSLLLDSGLIPDSQSMMSQHNISKQRMRSNSIGSGSISTSMSSFLSDLNSSYQDTNVYQSKSLTNLNTNTSNLFTSLKNLDIFEEKLATTGNIFQKRNDWSILNKLPVNKQNTIHIRLEDEGPFGNDEIRCFVLSHFSSLGIKNLSCIFCNCDLIIFDRFPLIDGTLFISPFIYDSKKAISTQSPNKLGNVQQSQIQQFTNKQKQSELCQQKYTKSQYIYGICLKCLLQEKDHDIECKFCSKSWQQMGGATLQIGTLYKYDIIAAFPCCQARLNCKKCNNPIISIDSEGLQFFSSYSQEKECDICKTKTYHFIKPLDDIFIIKQFSDQNDTDINIPDNYSQGYNFDQKGKEILSIVTENEE